MRISVLGISGMLGSAVFRSLVDLAGHAVVGTARSGDALRYFPKDLRDRIALGVDVESLDSLVRHFAEALPDVVINCIGLVKQVPESEDPLLAIAVNALLPHRLAHLCKLRGARLIHVSTDCVFAGTRGNYREDEIPDANDLYGRSKFLGEVGYPHTVTLRTSIIGHQLGGTHSLVEWFLAQQSDIRGYRRAIFSGLPTVELARVIRDFVIPNPTLTGLYHVGAAPIAKHDLLGLIAKQYGKEASIIADDKVVIDRSLDSSRFRTETGYVAPEWSELISGMHSDNKKWSERRLGNP